MGSHIDGDGKFQSDKYPTTPAGKVPLSVEDPAARDLLWEYARRRRAIDPEFSADLETCLLAAGHSPAESGIALGAGLVHHLRVVLAAIGGEMATETGRARWAAERGSVDAVARALGFEWPSQ